MRIEELRLDRFGFHIGRSMAFPAPAAGAPDIHIVAGDNGTGKSAICAAVPDLLFGFPHLTRWAIGYETSQLQLGAIIRDRNGRVLDFNRSKHRRDNLSGPGGAVLDETQLKSLIGGVDRRTFELLYSLDQTRLRRGGEEMLKAKNDVGQTIFAAASGLATLSEIRESLKNDIDSIGTSRRGIERPVWKAEQEYRNAIQKAQSSALRIEEWTDADQARSRAEAELESLNRESARLETERAKIERYLRCLPVLQELDRLAAEAEDLKLVRLLPSNFAARWSEAVLQHDRATAELERTRSIYTKRKAARDGLAESAGPLPGFSAEIEHLNTQIGSISDLIRDAGKLERDLDKTEKRLQALAANLGGKPDEVDGLISRIPAAATIAKVREMLLEQKGLATSLSVNREANKRETEALEQAKAELAGLGDPKEPKDAAALMHAARNVETDAKKVIKEKRALESAEKAENATIYSLKGWNGTAEDLLVAIFPTATALSDAKSKIDKAERSLEAANDKVANISEEIALIKDQHVGSASSVPSREDVECARAGRDRQWSEIRTDFEAGKTPSNEKFDGFETRVRTADQLIDERLEDADEVARQKQVESDLAGKQRLLNRAKAAAAEAEAALVEQRTAAAKLWDGTILKGAVSTPAEMTAWLAAKDRAVTAIESRIAKTEELEASKASLKAGISALRRAASHLGVRLEEKLDTLVAVEAASALVRQALEQAREAWTKSGQVKTEIRRRETESQKSADASRTAETNLEAWGKRWKAAMPAIGLSEDATPDTAKERIEHWAAFSEEAGLRAGTGSRLEGIQSDLSGHREAIEDLVEKIGVAFEHAPTADTWFEWPAFLYRALGAAKSIAKAIEHADEALQDAETDKSNAEETERSTAAALKKLREEAGVSEDQSVDETIESSRRRRETDSAIVEKCRALAEAGEGVDEETLRKELEGKTRADLIMSSAENKAARDKNHLDVQDAAGEQQQCRSRLRALEERTGYGAASHEAQNQAAEVGRLTQRWMRITAARVILDATIERYRQQHEGPMVKRAGEIFIAIAGNQAPDFFTKLDVDYSKPNDPHLIVMRSSGTAARVEELSEGTRDQLWLAFRIAALERRAEETEPMPFLADDLFASSDPTRAEIAVRYLLELGRSTQVILFTHHDYVVSAARKHLPNLTVHELKRDVALSVVA